MKTLCVKAAAAALIILAANVANAQTNTTCANAEPISAGIAVTLPESQGIYWYKFSAEAGKTYAANSTGSDDHAVQLYSDCNYAYIRGSEYAADADTTLYISVYRFEPIGFMVSEITGSQICANAEPISAGDTITPPATADYYWYKFSAQAGRLYAAAYTGGGNSSSPYLYTGCGGNYSNAFSPAADTALYVRSRGSYGAFKVIELAADYRVCATAMPINVGDTIQPLTANNWYRFKFSAQAGKSYAAYYINNDRVSIPYSYEAQCGVSSSDFPYTAAADTTLYMYVGDLNGAFTVSELTGSQVCNNAIQIIVGDTITPPSSGGYPYYWYKFSGQAGKSYDMFYTDSDYSAYDNIGTYGNCDWNNNGIPYTAYANSTIYVKVYGNYGSFKVVDEITDNRICPNAQQISVGDTIILPSNGNIWTYYYYKLSVQAGRRYEGHHINSSQGLTWMPACFNFNTYGNMSDIYTAHADTMLYIQGRKLYGLFIISEVTDERSCANTPQISVGDIISSATAANRYNWYKFSVQAGKTYTGEVLNDVSTVRIYTACGGSYLGNGSYTPSADTMLYVEVWSSRAFRINVAGGGNGGTGGDGGGEGNGGADGGGNEGGDGGGGNGNEGGGDGSGEGNGGGDGGDGGEGDGDGDNTTAVDADALPKLALHPNPADDMLYITDDFVGVVEIYDLAGTLVLTATSTSITISSLPSGIYVVKAGGRAAKVMKR